MKLYKAYKLLILLVPILFVACISAGTHGSIKAYPFPVKKVVLQQAIEEVIANNSNLSQAETIYNPIIDVTDGKHDTLPQYIDEAYVELNIKQEDGTYRFTFRYTGNDNNWTTDSTSEISIAYAFDKNGKGGSDGNGDIGWYTPFLKARLIKVFEQEFTNKLDLILGVKR